MWDWSGSKTPPPVRSRGEAAQEAQRQGVTPARRDFRDSPVYRDARGYRPLPPSAPASGYPDPYDDMNNGYINTPPVYPPTSPNPYGGQPYMGQPQPYMGQPQPYMPAQHAQPYMHQPQPYMPAQPAQPYMPQPQPYASAYPAQPYMPAQPAQPYMPPQPAQPYMPAQPAQPYMPAQQPSYQQNQQYGQMNPSMQNPNVPEGGQSDRSLWEWQFQEIGFANMDFVEVEHVMLDAAWLLELRKAFKRTRRDFLKYVGYHHVNELLAAGMDDNSIKLVKKGKAPENFNIHTKVPFEYGGTNSFSNLVLIQTHPFHSEIHKFIDKQVLGQPNFKPKTLFLPAPKGKVYFPGEIEVSVGGTSRHDRSVYAGFLESTFEMIAMKSSLGR